MFQSAVILDGMVVLEEIYSHQKIKKETNDSSIFYIFDL